MQRRRLSEINALLVDPPRPRFKRPFPLAVATLSDVMDVNVAVAAGVPFAIITAIKVQDVARQVWYNWGNQVSRGWDTSDWTGPQGQKNLKGAPSCVPGAGNLYIAFYAENQGSAILFTLEIVDDTGKILMEKYGSAGYLEGIGAEVTVDMPARSYGIKLTVVP